MNYCVLSDNIVYSRLLSITVGYYDPGVTYSVAQSPRYKVDAQLFLEP
jgi:hypothetical protein